MLKVEILINKNWSTQHFSFSITKSINQSSEVSQFAVSCAKVNRFRSRSEKWRINSSKSLFPSFPNSFMRARFSSPQGAIGGYANTSRRFISFGTRRAFFFLVCVSLPSSSLARSFFFSRRPTSFATDEFARLRTRSRLSRERDLGRWARVRFFLRDFFSSPPPLPRSFDFSSATFFPQRGEAIRSGVRIPITSFFSK